MSADTMNGRIEEFHQRLAELVADVPDLTAVLRGSVRKRYVRCGKKGCHCQEGRGHGPVYYLSVSLGAGKTKQITLTEETYELAQQYVHNYARWKEVLEEASSLNREILVERRKQTRRRGRDPGK